MDIKRFTDISEGASSHDGESVIFRIDAEDAEPLTLTMQSNELGDVIQWLAYLAKDAASKRGVAKSFDPKQPLSVPAIPATQIGLMLGSPGSAIVVIRLFDFDLAFELPLAELQRALPSFGRTISTLAKEPKAPQ